MSVRPNDIDDRSQGDVAYGTILGALRSGDYAPGDRLREVEIAERLGLSRTPIREALRRLEADGIIEHRARIGAVIRRLGRSELVELYEMRMVLERTAAALSAKHAHPAEIDALETLNAKIAEQRDDSAQAAALNQQFHAGLYDAARNRFLLDAARGLNNALLLLGPTTLIDAARIDTVCSQHSQILAALRAADAAAAAEAAETHLQTSLRHRLSVLPP